MLTRQSKFSFLKAFLPSLSQRYDRAAQKWHGAVSKLGYVEAYSELIRSTISKTELNNIAPISVLDAGCGSGAFSLALCKQLNRPATIKLLDISTNMLEQAQKNLSNQPHKFISKCGTIDSIGTADEKYDLALCAHVIDHLPDPISALRSLRMVLKPDSTLLLVVSKPHWCTSIVQLKWHHNAYKPAKVMHMLKQAGFSHVMPFEFPKGPPKFTSHGYVVRPARNKKERE